MSDYEIILPKLHAGQEEVIRTQSRYNALSAGRRWGKSSVLGLNRLILPALAGLPVAWFAPTYKTLSTIWRIVDRITLPIQASRNIQEKRLILITGGLIDMWSMDSPDSSLGNAYARVVCDEVAVTSNFLYHWNKTIRPMLTDYRGDAFFLSTPKGYNDFQRLWWNGAPQNPNRLEDWQSWQMPTSSNPYIDPREIEDAKRDQPPHIFQQEYLAEFIEAPGGLIFDTWSEEGNVTVEADYIPGGGMLFWGADDGYVGEIDKSTSFPTGDSHPRVILFGQLRSNGVLAIFQELWLIGVLEDPHIEQALGLGYPEPDYVAIDSSAASLRGHFHEHGIQTLKSTHSVEEGIKAVRSGLAPDRNQIRRIIVHPRCYLLRYEMKKYARDENGKILKRHDHALDTLRYMYHSLG